MQDGNQPARLTSSKIKHLNPGYSLKDIPPQWRPKYVLKRVSGDDLEIGIETRDRILESLQQGKRFVQIGEHTIMLNAINAIDPFWGTPNRPPKPTPFRPVIGERFEGNVRVQEFGAVENDDEISLWEKLFETWEKQ